MKLLEVEKIWRRNLLEMTLHISLPNIKGRSVSSSVRARTPPQSVSSPSIHGDQRPLPPRPCPAPRSTVPSASPSPSPTTTSLPSTPNAAEPLSPLTRPSRAAAVPRRSPSRTPTSPPPAFASPTGASPTASRARPWTGRKAVVHRGTAWEVPPAAARTASASVGGGGDDGPLKTKGRGFCEDPNSFSAPRDSRLVGVSRAGFDALASDGGPGPVRSIEGWIVLVTGIHEEAQEDDLHNIFGNFGQVKNLHLNLDRRTGFVKGYALIEYENFEEAQAAIKASDGTELLTQIISVDWAFSNGPVKRRNTWKRSPRPNRSRSPPRRRY